MDGVLFQWHKTVKPSYDEFVHPTLKKADIIVNGNSQNWKAVNFVVSNLKTILASYYQAPIENGSQAQSEETDEKTDEIEPQRSRESAPEEAN